MLHLPTKRLLQLLYFLLNLGLEGPVLGIDVFSGLLQLCQSDATALVEFAHCPGQILGSPLVRTLHGL